MTTDLLKFIDAAPTPFHAADEVAARLEAVGFQELREKEADWAVEPSGAYYVKRNGSSLIALRLPSQARVESFRIVGAHTDSPNLRLKPFPDYVNKGYVQLGVEVYGGVLLNSWLDRDLSIAGRVTYSDEPGAPPRSSLVRFDEPLCRVPQLAIHLDRGIREKGLLLNAQQHMPPILALAPDSGGEPGDDPNDAAVISHMLAERLGVSVDRMLAMELHLYPVEPSVRSGLNGEFIHAPRLDNLAMCHAAITALSSARPTPAGQLSAVALFDNEEVGSESAQGAGSPFLGHVLERITLAVKASREQFLAALPRSHFISADMAHAVHPNYADRHDERHEPLMNAGPVIKINSNQRYATNSETAGLFEILARENAVPVQKFVNRTDLACGSTIGPITAASLGIPTVDVGNAMLSMHSAREMAGAEDPARMVAVFTSFFA